MAVRGAKGPFGGDLVPVHGGLAEPVDRIVSAHGPQALPARGGLAAVAAREPRRPLDGAPDRRRRALAARRADEREAVWHRVLDEARDRGRRQAATPGRIPLSLPGDRRGGARRSRAAASAALRDRGGRAWSRSSTTSRSSSGTRPRYVQRVYGTERFDHPGGRMVEADRAHASSSAARLRALPQPVHPEYGEYMLSPRMTRALIRDRKWERALAFQTRNPLHRAHEYALVAGAERLTGEGFFTGVVLNPLVGELKGDDVPAAMRMRCYRALHDRAPARPGRQGRGALGARGLRPDRRLRADRPRHQDVLRRPVARR